MAKAPMAKRYAQALFSLAEAEESREAWLDDLAGIQEQMADSSVALFFGEPRVPAERKQEAAARIAEGARPLVRNFLGLLAQRQATGSLPAIVSEYRRLLNERLGRAQAVVTTAAPISAEQRGRLAASLGAMLDKEVVLDEREDPEIIGGIVVRIEDRIIDGSVRSRLNGLRQSLGRQAPVPAAYETEERA